MSIRRFTSRILRGVLGLILLHIISPQASVLAATDYYHTVESFRLSPGASVVVEVAFHDVEVTVSPDYRVEVEVNTEITAASEQNVARLLKEYKPVFTERADRLQIISRSDGHSNFNWNCSGKIKIAVPAQTSVGLKSASGACVVRGNFDKNTITVSTASGDISFRGETERLTANSASGKINAEFAGPAALVQARTASGAIRINGPVKKTELYSISGMIEMWDLQKEINVSTVSGSINGYWETIPNQIILAADSVSGDLRFRFPEWTTVGGELETTSGRIDSEFPGRFSGRSNRLFILEGGYDVQVHASTVSGSIELSSKGSSFFTPIETLETHKPAWPDVSSDFFDKDHSPVFMLNLCYHDRMLAPGLKYRLHDGLYAKGNFEYSYQEWALRMQLGAVYYLPHDFFIFSFYGGGGVQFSGRNGYQYPYVVMGADFLFLFTEIIYPWEINYAPSSRFGFSFNF